MSFVRKEKDNRKYLLGGVAAAILQFILFKLFYPFPDYFEDSNWYIFAATHDLNINIWPIGYSKFLSAFHYLSHSSLGLVAFQFFLFESAAFYFFFTILYFFRPEKFTKIVLFAALFVNPLNLYLANTIASDTIFGALTLIWLAELIRIIQGPRIYQLFTQALLLFFCFTLRNTTYYYPLIAALAFVLSPQAWWRKIAGIALPVLFVAPFVIFTRNLAKSLTGTAQPSLLSGWQLGNNALYIYNHIKVDSTEFPTPEAREINRIAAKFFKRADLDKYYASFDANIYIVADPSPIRQYWERHNRDIQGPYAAAINWGVASAAIGPFGKAIILHHPWGYFRYFMLTNIGNYLYPPLCDLSSFHMDSNHAFPDEKTWFDYQSDRITSISNNFQRYLIVYSWLFLLINAYFLFEGISLVLKRKSIFLSKTERHLLILLGSYISINFLFTITASINLLRYQYIPMLVLATASFLIGERTAGVWERKSRAKFVTSIQK